MKLRAGHHGDDGWPPRTLHFKDRQNVAQRNPPNGLFDGLVGRATKEAQRSAARDGFDPIVYAKLTVDVFEVFLDGAWSNVQTPSGCGILWAPAGASGQ